MAKPRWRILIVDDSQADRELYCRRLQRDPHADYDIHEVELGEQGLAACAATTPDCILLDYRLPDLTGIQFLERLPAQTNGQRPAVVLITASGSERVAVDALQHGAQDYLVKGTTTPEQLWRAVANAIEKATLRRDFQAQQQALQESEVRYRALTDLSPDAILVNAHGRYVYANAAALQLVGATDPQQVVGHSPLEFVEVESLALVRERVRLVLEERQVAPQVSYRCKRLDETLIDVEVASSPIPWQGSLALQVRVRDITARVQAEAERERLIAELQRTNDEFQQFSYIVSHDLNEPLRTMRNFLQLLASRLKGTVDADATECMAFVTDAAQRMQQMLTDLLAYTKAGQTPEFQSVDCEAVLAQVLSALLTRIMECEAVITHDPLPTIQGDATRLGQVLQNLIGNALKFRGDTPPRIHVSVVKEEDHWRFAVRDNGIGIDPQHTGKLFQVFQRAHGTEYRGTGIGLAICKKIVEQHGGRIWVESKPGEGSIFHFTVSRCQPQTRSP